MDPVPVVSPLAGSLLDVQVLGPHPRPTNSEILEMETSSLCFNWSFR
jgi:hypothetical protein